MAKKKPATKKRTPQPAPKTAARKSEPLLDTPPDQPTLDETVAEPFTGPETEVVDAGTPPVEDDDAVQPALIPMSDDELREAGQALAVKVRDYATMEADHAAIRAEHSDQRKKLKESITALAQCIRQQGR